MRIDKPRWLLTLLLTVGFSRGAFGSIAPCDEASGVLGSFPRAFCMDTTSGQIGGAVSIGVPATLVTVPENPNGTADVDVFVLLQKMITAPPTLEYTTTFAWDTPVDPSSLVFREWVGNFSFTPPRALPLTFVNAPDSANEIRPDEFSWTLNEDGLALGAQVTSRSVDAIPPHANLPSIERYHWKITGLEAGTNVTFSKSVSGGAVVPPPSVPRGRFENPISIGTGVNTGNLEWNPVVSHDGLALLFFSDRPGGFGAWDIYEATRTSVDEPFGNVVNLGSEINSSLDDLVGSVSTDGKVVYISSDRPGGLGGEDLYMLSRSDVSQPFGNLVSLGESVNTRFIDGSPFVFDNGLGLLFMSDRSGNMDLFSATRATIDVPFEPAVPVGEVNTGLSEFRPTLSSDGLVLMFSDDLSGPRNGGRGQADVWVAVRDSASQPFGDAVNLSDMWPGSSINTSADEIVPFISPDWPAAGSKLYYVTDRRRVGDIYTATWIPELAGDLNGNGVLEINDVDLLSAAIVRGSTATHFDLDVDGNVSSSDLDTWVGELRRTWSGDANLDGEFNSGDLVDVFKAGEYEDTVQGNSRWSTGDWNADGEFDSSDMVLAFQGGGYEAGPVQAMPAVPEPAANSLLAIAAIGSAMLRRRRS